MDKEHVKGAADKAKDAAHSAMGDAKNAVRNASK